MKKRNALLLTLFAALVPSMTGCSSIDDTINLRVLNAEDYFSDEVIEAFEEWEREENGKNVRVVYDTFDTIESMLSSLDTSKAIYDLICPSDYAVEKLIKQNRLRKFNFDNIPNYDNCSPYLRGVLDNLSVTVEGQPDEKMGDYCVGYMWGTLGIVYNPAKLAEEQNLEEDEIKLDMNNWETLWDSKYHGQMSVKDSMRDTYSVGVMYSFSQEIKALMQNSGCFDEFNNLIPGKYEDAVSTYNNAVSAIFNRCDEETTKLVQSNLLALKRNVFGFECDSGKDDIVKGYIGINLAWSGDAVYSLDRGENESDTTLYYSVPQTGGNIWFDSWIMPESDDLHQEEAEEFVNFISDPAMAALNMDETGYTSFIGGDDILDLIRQWYDPRSYAMYVWHDDPEDWESSDFLYDDEDEIVYRDGTGYHDEDEEGNFYGMYDMRGSTYEAPVCKDPVSGIVLASTWEEYQELVMQATENEEIPEDEYIEEKWLVRDLTYMFEGSITLEDGFVLGTTPDTNPYLFYTDELEEIENSETGEVVIAGRQFYTQYPDQTIIPKLCVMRDFGKNNKYVLTLWENVKSDALPTWGIITFAALIAAGVGIILLVVFKKQHSKKIRRARKKTA